MTSKRCNFVAVSSLLCEQWSHWVFRNSSSKCKTMISHSNKHPNCIVLASYAMASFNIWTLYDQYIKADLQSLQYKLSAPRGSHRMNILILLKIRLSNLVLIPDMNVFDCDLQIIYDLDYQFGKISLLILFSLFSFLYEICKHRLAVVLDLFFSSFDDFSVFAIPMGMWELSYHDLETLK